jgi:outer membrane protein assembly factor BamD (BamD/ComL family)
LIEFFTNETDLAVADRLSIAISALAKEDFHPRDFHEIQTWWSSHQNEYTNWPTDEFNAGWNSFLVKGDYSHALSSFLKVMVVDPTADQSRALAIACCFETGQTNKASELAKDFRLSDGRWSKWAAALAELKTGNFSNATVQFADLTKKQPTLFILPDEGAGAWRGIDWQLFRKLVSPENEAK